ncbi:hypothetical protein [Desulforhopalus sp. 52FAK]
MDIVLVGSVILRPYTAMKFIDTIPEHRKTPDITLDLHTKSKRDQLCKEISGRTKIYLDTNFWIRFRDVLLGRITDTTIQSSLDVLRKLVAENKVICPISDAIYYELLLQTDHLTLRKTVEIMDELSQGVTILSTDERVRFEILYFLRSFYDGQDSILQPDEMIWSKVAYSYGLTHPTNTFFNEAEELVIQKSFFDQMWSMTLNDLIEIMGMENIRKWPRHKDLSGKLTREKVQYAHENNSFKQVYLSELAGVLDVYKSTIVEGFIYFYREKTGSTETITDHEKKESQKFVNAIYNLFKLNKLGVFFPSFIVEAGLYASVRHDIRRTFKKNDLPDFSHAKAAIPYFNAFFTERSLKDLICRNNVALDLKYSCKVFSKPKEAKEYLVSLHK